MATSSITHNFVVSNPNMQSVLSQQLTKPTVTYTKADTSRTSVNEPTGNLSFNVKKEENNMSDKYFTVNIRAYLDKDEPIYRRGKSLRLTPIFLLSQKSRCGILFIT